MIIHYIHRYHGLSMLQIHIYFILISLTPDLSNSVCRLNITIDEDIHASYGILCDKLIIYNNISIALRSVLGILVWNFP